MFTYRKKQQPHDLSSLISGRRRHLGDKSSRFRCCFWPGWMGWDAATQRPLTDKTRLLLLRYRSRILLLLLTGERQAHFPPCSSSHQKNGRRRRLLPCCYRPSRSRSKKNNTPISCLFVIKRPIPKRCSSEKTKKKTVAAHEREGRRSCRQKFKGRGEEGEVERKKEKVLKMKGDRREEKEENHVREVVAEHTHIWSAIGRTSRRPRLL